MIGIVFCALWRAVATRGCSITSFKNGQGSSRKKQASKPTFCSSSSQCRKNGKREGYLQLSQLEDGKNATRIRIDERREKGFQERSAQQRDVYQRGGESLARRGKEERRKGKASRCNGV